MKRCLIISLILVFYLPVSAQTGNIDSLKHEVESSRNDTMRYVRLGLIAQAYQETKPDSSFYYYSKNLEIARKLKLKLEEASTLGKMGYAQQEMGNYPASLKTYLSAIGLANDPESGKIMLAPKYLQLLDNPDMSTLNPYMTGSEYRIAVLALLHTLAGILYENANDYETELYYLKHARQYSEQIKDTFNLNILNYILGRVYLSLQKNDSAFIYLQKSYDYHIRMRKPASGVLLTLGKYYLAIGKDQEAVYYIRKALSDSRNERYSRGVIASSLLLSATSRKYGKMDSSLYFANSALALAQQMKTPDLLLRTWSELVAVYRLLHRSDSTVKYQALIIQLKDSLFNSKQAQAFKNIDFDERHRQQEIENVKIAYKDRLQKYGLLGGLIVFFFVAIILWRNNRNKQKAYALLNKQKQETDFQKSKVEQTLEELRSTQSQLIQSEKMASLGELTAGIAHEIQNPLNFVNNFSEVNNELVGEMVYEFKNGNTAQGEAIAKDLQQNLEKINHHGKRADAIVKNMLQHSKTSSSTKEPTDINALCDEYLRLAYHGMRAKDKAFNAKMETSFDSSIEKLNIIPQEIGRVMLNLLNNAFYAVNEKAKLGATSYEPRVAVRTRKVDSRVEIHVEDNGNGIPQKILDKIFQPFFTTKPAGQGTGLGLSLAYDIVKAHGGDVKVETKEGEGSEFRIQLPIKSN